MMRRMARSRCGGKARADPGRKLIQQTLQTSLELQARAIEKKSEGSRVCSCGRTKSHHGRKSRVVMTSSGEICLFRVYFRCVACGDGGFAADLRLGIHSRYSVEAERLVCLAAASWSYYVSSDRLEEFCGLKIGDTAIREISQRRGAAMNAWQNSDPEACREFASLMARWNSQPTERALTRQKAGEKRNWRSFRSDNWVKQRRLTSGRHAHCRLPICESPLPRLKSE